MSLDQGDVRLDISVYDKHGNLVEDGAEVEFDFGDSFIIKDQQQETINGRAYIVLTGGTHKTDNVVVSIQSGAVRVQMR